MRDRVKIMRKTPAIGSLGQDTGAFTQLQKRWGEFEHLGGRELESARKVYAEATAKVRIRKPYNITLTTKDRIEFRGELFGIGGIVPIAPRFEFVDLLLARVV